INERIDRRDDVEKTRSERQRSRIRLNWKNAVVGAGILNPLEILRGAEPEVGPPDLHPEFAVQEDRRNRASAAEVQNPHPGLQVKRLAEPLRQPQGIGPATEASKHPFRVVLRGTGESLRDKC